MGFAEFSSNKLTAILQSFTGTLQYHPDETNTPKFTNFRPLTNDVVKREIISMKNQNYDLDQISTQMLKRLSLSVCQPLQA